MKKLFILFALVGLLLSAPTHPVQAQDRCQLAEAALILTGYTPRANHDHRQISYKSHTTLQKTFIAGKTYAILVSPSNSANLDIYLYDDLGNLITYDNTHDSTGIIEFTVYRTTTFKVLIENRSGYSTDASIVYGYSPS